jgi:hypothetical protein
MTTQLKWRLTKLPTVDEITTLLKEKIISQEEAKDILFNKETETDRDIESYKQEIKFLKEVIEKLGDRKAIIQVVKEYVPHYISQPFYEPYWTYTTTGTSGTMYLDCSGNSTTSSNCSFSSIIS